MIYICFQALGDNVISIDLLSQINKKIKVIGTQHTKNIIELLGLETHFSVTVLYDDIPAFYDVKRQGVKKAIKDVIKFRTYIKTNNLDNLIFEKQDFRISILTRGIVKRTYSRTILNNVYVNRKDLIESIFKKTIELKSALPPFKNTKNILINPISGNIRRNISISQLLVICDLLKVNNFNVSIVDHQGDYSEFQNNVDHYYCNTSLEEVKQLIMDHDFFIGTDSFLIHLAHALDKPYFIIFNYKYFDFLPPYVEILNNYIITTNTKNLQLSLSEKFKSIGLL